MRDDDAVRALDSERQSNRAVGLFVLGLFFGAMVFAALVLFWR